MDQRLKQQSTQQLGAEAQVRTERRNFEEAEEVIRADREQIAVPETLAGKLAGSIAAAPKSPAEKPWWKCWFV